MIRTKRGGLITYHNPGQLICYPILNLKKLTGRPGARDLVCKLERSVMSTLLNKNINLKSQQSEDTGIWIGNDKICALGLKIDSRVTMHGLALNCNNDLKGFSEIVPCGLIGKGVTSVSKQKGSEITVEDVIPIFLKEFQEKFDVDLI